MTLQNIAGYLVMIGAALILIAMALWLVWKIYREYCDAMAAFGLLSGYQRPKDALSADKDSRTKPPSAALNSALKPPQTIRRVGARQK